jgi:hypothetical protein
MQNANCLGKMGIWIKNIKHTGRNFILCGGRELGHGMQLRTGNNL